MSATTHKGEGIRVTVLGSGTCVPSLVRSACAVLMEVGEAEKRMMRGSWPAATVTAMLHEAVPPAPVAVSV